jgi:hypothetical protein
MLLAGIVLVFLLVEMALLALPAAARIASRESTVTTADVSTTAGGFASHTSSITADGAAAIRRT